jgi:hypothetical protein
MTAADPITTVFTLRIRDSGVYELWMEGEQVATGDWPNGFPVTAFAAPALSFDSSAAAGSDSTAIRTDATVALFDVTAPATLAFGQAAAVGTAAKAARRDHEHGMPDTETLVQDRLAYVPTGTGEEAIVEAVNGQTAVQTVSAGTYVPTDAYAVQLAVIIRRTGDTDNVALTVMHYDGTIAGVAYSSGVANRGGSGNIGPVVLGGINNRQFKWATTDAGSDNDVYIYIVGYWTKNP